MIAKLLRYTAICAALQLASVPWTGAYAVQASAFGEMQAALADTADADDATAPDPAEESRELEEREKERAAEVREARETPEEQPPEGQPSKEQLPKEPSPKVQLSEDQTSEDRSTEGKTSEDHSSEDQTPEDQSPEGTSSGEKSSEEGKPSGGQLPEEQPAQEREPEKQAPGGQEPEKQGAEGRKEKLSEHVKGVKDFSVIEGMYPDVMSGVTWDGSILDVIADTTDVRFDTPGTYTLTYTAYGQDDSGSEAMPITVTVYADLEHYLYGMEGEALIETGADFDPMEHVVYDDPIASVTADLSALDVSRQGEYLIPYLLTGMDGRTQTAVRRVKVTDEIERPEGVPETTEAYSTVTDLGLWRLTAYMDTPEDQGPYVGQTASGAPLVAGRTVAVSSATCARLGLMFGDRLMIDGHIYILEDHGGYAMYDQNWVDIYVDNPADEYSDLYNRYAEVYLLR